MEAPRVPLDLIIMMMMNIMMMMMRMMMMMIRMMMMMTKDGLTRQGGSECTQYGRGLLPRVGGSRHPDDNDHGLDDDDDDDDDVSPHF